MIAGTIYKDIYFKQDCCSALYTLTGLNVSPQSNIICFLRKFLLLTMFHAYLR